MLYAFAGIDTYTICVCGDRGKYPTLSEHFCLNFQDEYIYLSYIRFYTLSLAKISAFIYANIPLVRRLFII